ncbi:MAG TPA: hypothetical protein PKH37_07010 [Alphaproteobacteria bacterium]|nr:hypothetical protein [Alphaproteobacteria bacterium]
MTTSNYEKEFQIFSSNLNQAARAFYYHQEIQRQVYEDCMKYKSWQESNIYQAIQDNAQFWEDYKDLSILCFVITLRKIFDKDKNGQESHHIDRLIKSVKNSDLFTNQKLRERKIKGSDNADDWIDEYMKNTHQLSETDFSKIEDFVSATKEKWDSVKPLCNKILAHQDALTPQKRSQIFENSKYAIFEEIITRLLTVENILWQAYHNGQKPDFGYVNNKVRNAVAYDVVLLLGKLSSGKARPKVIHHNKA